MFKTIARFTQFIANWFEFVVMWLAILTIMFVTVEVVLGAAAV